MKKIGLFGGTFDPPHIGHFIIAQEVMYKLKLDEIWFVPTNIPPHKEQAYFDKQHRLTMLQKAVEENPFFHVHPIELQREGKSYTFDTVRQFKKQYPDNQFYFLIGADMVAFLPNWQQIEELIQLVKFVGVARPSYSLKTDYPIIKVDVPMIDISSTEIRRRLEDGMDVKYFLPHEVYLYLKEQLL